MRKDELVVCIDDVPGWIGEDPWPLVKDVIYKLTGEYSCSCGMRLVTVGIRSTVGIRCGCGRLRRPGEWEFRSTRFALLSDYSQELTEELTERILEQVKEVAHA